MIIFSPTAHGCGRLTGAFEADGGGVMALASEFEFLAHTAGRRAFTGHALRHRLSLHRPGEARPFAWFDHLRLPINSVAFHPGEPVVVIGAGAHDGGYAYNGDLVVWNWVDGTVRRPFSGLPEVVHLAFDAEGGLGLLFRPWNEDWGHGGEDEVILYPLTLPPDSLGLDHGLPDIAADTFIRPADPEAYDPDYGRARQRAAQFLRTESFAPSRPVWGIGWFGDDTVGWVTGARALDLHDLATGESRALAAEAHGFGTAIVVADRPLVQVVRSWMDPNGRYGLQTGLAELAGGTLSEIVCRPYTSGVTGSASGGVLGRQVRKSDQPAGDFVREPAGHIHETDFGAYAPYDDHLGVQGAPDLYILQAPRGANGPKHVCRVTPSGAVEPLWPLLSEREEAVAVTECCAAYVDDEAGESLVMAAVHAPQSGSPRGFIHRRTLDGRELWRFPVDAAATALVWLPAFGALAAAFLDGRLAVIDAVTGQAQPDGFAVVEGAPAVIFAMAAHRDGRLALGGMDGQVMVVRVEALTAVDGLIELA